MPPAHTMSSAGAVARNRRLGSTRRGGAVAGQARVGFSVLTPDRAKRGKAKIISFGLFDFLAVVNRARRGLRRFEDKKSG